MNTYVLSGHTSTTDLQRGLVVIELVITLPLVILIMFATAELGRVLFQYTTLTKAVEAGTRYYASEPIPTTDTLEKLVFTASPDGSGDPVLPDFGEGNGSVSVVPEGSDHIRVTAVYYFKPIVKKLPIFGIVPDITLTASHTMRAAS